MKKHIALLSLVLLSGCAVRREDVPCPRAGYMTDAADVARFERIEKKGQLVDVTHFSAALDNLKSSCRMAGPDMMEVSLAFAVRATKDQTLKDITRGEVPYFIALLGPDDAILKRSTFTAMIPFDDDEARMNPLTGNISGMVAEEHDIRIPVASKTAAAKNKIAVGFILTPDQLDHNRRAKASIIKARAEKR